ncbi:MAG: transposase [Planctomycetes bacterium]|nr:transposase [Planctomycetota bacterium]
MARIARVVVPGYPHLVTQRGNRRQPVFFSKADYRVYLDLVAEECRRCHVSIWAYCLMRDHVHLVAVPHAADDLARALAEAHRRYTRRVNMREGWQGFLWQGRFSSCALGPNYALEAVRYVEQNPVRAGRAKSAWLWPWSSAAARVKRKDDVLVRVVPLLEEVPDWRRFLARKADAAILDLLRMHVRTGRPLGDLRLIRRLERRLGRPLVRRRPGRPPKKRPK